MTAREKIYFIFIRLIKNLAVFLIGAALGVLATFMYAEPLLKSAIPKDVGLGVIALAPLLILFYAMFFGAIGGTIAIVLYYAIKIVRSRRATHAHLKKKRE